MASIDTDRVISLTQLQKLSLKKLRTLSTPLYVMDLKSQRQAFVILDWESFARMQEGDAADQPTEKIRPALERYDFKAKGLFWDRPEMNNKRFVKILNDEKHPEHVWAISRLMERLPSQEVLQLFSLSMIETILKKAQLRPQIRRPWEHALNYWRQTSSYRR